MAILKANSTVNNQSITGNTATLSVSSTPGSSNVTTRVLSKSYDGQLIWSDLHPLAAVNIYTPVFQGSQSGYFSAFQTTDYSVATEIEKFSFSAESPSTGVGNLTSANPTYHHSGHSSASDGYVTGGATNTGPPNYTTTYLDSIQKFPFSSDSDASDVAELAIAKQYHSSHSSPTHGYTAGGATSPIDPIGYQSDSNHIQKFPFSSDSSGSDIGDLVNSASGRSGFTSTSHGYVAGGDVIEKFPFSSDSNASDVGEITVSTGGRKGAVSSESHGYLSGGPMPFPSQYGTIEKFPFSSDSPSSDVGELPYKVQSQSGVSSTTKGYFAGGYSQNILTPSPSDTPSAPPGTLYRTDVNSLYYSSDTPATFTLNTIKSVTVPSSGGSHQI